MVSRMQTCLAKIVWQRSLYLLQTRQNARHFFSLFVASYFGMMCRRAEGVTTVRWKGLTFREMVASPQSAPRFVEVFSRSFFPQCSLRIISCSPPPVSLFTSFTRPIHPSIHPIPSTHFIIGRIFYVHVQYFFLPTSCASTKLRWKAGSAIACMPERRGNGRRSTCHSFSVDVKSSRMNSFV